MIEKLRILYAAGPGNVIGTYQHWINGRDDPGQVSLTYSGQFYDVCHELGAHAYILSSHPEKRVLKDGQFTLEHRPARFTKTSGINYHLGKLWYGLRLIWTALRFKAMVVIVADETTHWFLLSLLPLFGISVIPTLHCVLWCPYIPLSSANRLLLKLNRYFFSRSCATILSASGVITQQLQELSSNQAKPIWQFLPSYRRHQFVNISQPTASRSPFRIFFAGRIEANKGVFDLLEISKRFAFEGQSHIRFDLCGDGSALPALRQAIEVENLEVSFVCHGHCDKTRMSELLAESHVVVVPTRTDFPEGFNQVLVEGVLAGRPVITSKVCPATELVPEAIVEVKPDDIESYANAIQQLCDDLEFYQLKQSACKKYQEQFYDLSQGWGNALKQSLVWTSQNFYHETDKRVINTVSDRQWL